MKECPAKVFSSADLVTQYQQGNNLCELNYDWKIQDFGTAFEISETKAIYTNLLDNCLKDKYRTGEAVFFPSVYTSLFTM